MTDKPTIVLVHGAFAESASWNGVIARLQEHGVTAVAAANPLRSLAGDAAYVRDVIASIGGPVVLVGHSYGGLVITEAAARNDAVVGLVYVAAFVPETGQSAFELSTSAPGSTLGDALAAYPVATGGNEFVIRQELFPHQFAADVPDAEARLMAATQRPVTQAALSEGLPTSRPAWKDIPSWHVFGDQDLNIPVAVHRAGAERAASRGIREIAGASHAISVSQPDAVAATIAEAGKAYVASLAASAA
ncbi:alpha/beta fold hydrolase [Microbacterium ulmi]|uniref:Alpha/beta hydrolase n=1 Tax=Microbacterium ulmi TaxID=179095 RepID=A0A7Y2Q1Q6_9MICO|nr:alpha/beta hydrolase [Microbacterium ulmi]NII68945.1 pimeloyl-ACP methyl ester carboxylesterase [Microbacterium ulmi]NNH03928.1 alpha/beta hydrolase [Microbacterium ulmi]